ncbi:hypothetical protein ACFL6S_32110, partial [Candidatus Poribacteria bacterium]
MIDILPEWMPQNGHQRQGNNGLNLPGIPSDSPKIRSLLEQENIALLLLNSLAFGEDERITELIQQERSLEALCDELGLVIKQFTHLVLPYSSI